MDQDIGDRLAQGGATIYSPGRGLSPPRHQAVDGCRVSARPIPPAPLVGSPTITTRLTRPANGAGAREIWAPLADAGAQTPVLRNFERKGGEGSSVHRVQDSRGVCVVGVRDAVRTLRLAPSAGGACVSKTRQLLAAGQSARAYTQATPKVADLRRQWSQYP